MAGYRIAAALLIALASCAQGAEADDAAVEETLAPLTLRQKLGQMFIVGFPGRTLDEDGLSLIRDHAVGGFFVQSLTNFLFPEDLAALTHTLQSVAAKSPTGIPLFLAADDEGGPANIIHPEFGGTPTPGNLALGASGRVEDTRASYNTIGEEMKACGLNMDLAPAIDVLGSTANPDYTVRSFGSQTAVNARLGVAAIGGLHEAGIMAVAKHFPALAFFDGDTHIEIPHLPFSAKRLAEPDLLAHMRAVIQAGVPVIMTAHVYINAWDHVYPVTMSSKILFDHLRNDLGFEGLIMSDSLGMGAINQDYDWDTVVVRAVMGGCDILLQVSSKAEDLTRRIDTLESAIASGLLSQERVDDAVRRILRAKLQWEFDVPQDPKGGSPLDKIPEKQQRLDAAKTAARNGVVVVCDKNSLLPVSPSQPGVVVVCPPSIVTRAGKPDGEKFPLGFGLGHYVKQAIPDAREVIVDTVPTIAQHEHVLKNIVGAKLIVAGVLFAEQSPKQQELIRAILKSDAPTILVGLGLPSDLALFPEAETFVAANGPTALNCEAAVGVMLGVAKAGGTLPVSIGNLYPAGHQLVLP